MVPATLVSIWRELSHYKTILQTASWMDGGNLLTPVQSCLWVKKDGVNWARVGRSFSSRWNFTLVFVTEESRCFLGLGNQYAVCPLQKACEGKHWGRCIYHLWIFPVLFYFFKWNFMRADAIKRVLEHILMIKKLLSNEAYVQRKLVLQEWWEAIKAD